MINGHEYEIQEIWSDATKGCEQRSTATTDGLPLPVVSMRQFSPEVSGSIGSATHGVAVRVALVRAGQFVAEGGAVTRANGSWGPTALRGPHGVLHGLGDDRDEVVVEYGHGGPAPDVIATGAGGEPFSEAGFTDWLDLDTGFELAANAIALAPCSQTGLLTVTVDGKASASPVSECETELDATVVALSHVSAGSQVLMTSEDNRAVTEDAPMGALVRLTVPLGEPGSVPTIEDEDVPFLPSGVPECSVELRTATVTCTGLVPDARYTLTRKRGNAVDDGHANAAGVATFAGLPGSDPVTGGDLLTLRNVAHRALTALHVAHLRVAIDGNQTVLASGTCQPGDYWGAQLTTEPESQAVGEPGATGTGAVCPANGNAKGLSDAPIAQTDDLSGGMTTTSLPTLEGEAPAEDATVYGGFRALAQTGVPGPHGSVVHTSATVSVSVRLAGSKHVVWKATNVDTAQGVAATALPKGVYDATWVISDRNGDTRTVATTFVAGRLTVASAGCASAGDDGEVGAEPAVRRLGTLVERQQTVAVGLGLERDDPVVARAAGDLGGRQRLDQARAVGAAQPQ